jgi:hypothetical protein
MRNNILKFSTTIAFLFSCSQQSSDQSGPSGPAAVELSECTTSTTYDSTAYVTGTATFAKRTLNVSHNGTTVSRLILSQNATASSLPIRYAEIRVTDGSGATVQCGRTNATGAMKALDGVSNLSLPPTAGSYTVTVYSRSNTSIPVLGGKPNFNFYASVKNDLTNLTVYSVTSTVSSSGAGSVTANVHATHSESVSPAIEGGAFNIYNDILAAYDYIAFNTGTLDTTCLSGKLDIFWKAGYNPAQYIYPTADAGSLGTISFYVKGDSQMFINGGRLGDVTTQDTDHFDDAVIIHELGHHVESVCGTMDSPGGAHNGLFRIDPRLAWSEGWGNFFGAHIIRNKASDINPDFASILPASGWLFYYDSEGYGTANGFEYIRINLSRLGNSTSETLYVNPGTPVGVTYDPVNPTSYPGESHFREVSVARGLFKGTNTCTNCTNTNYFTNYWQAIEKNNSGVGMGKSIYPFRSSIKFIDRIRAAQGGTLAAGLTALFTTDEALQPIGSADFVVSGNPIWIPYGVRLVPSGSACNLKIQPRRNNLSANTDTDQRYSNHFFLIDKASLPAVTAINLSASKDMGTTVDLDAVLFNLDYKFDQDYQEDSNGNITTYNKSVPSDAALYSRGTSDTESLNISGLSSSSYYLLNIRAYSSTPNTILSTTEYTYTLKDQSGGDLCPATSF